MLPMHFFRKRSFAVTNVVSVSMYFGMFGSIFFLSQFLQNVLGNSPLQAGLKLLVWTGATMVVAPIAGVLSERYEARWFMVAGLSLQAGALAWLASIVSLDTPYSSMLIPFVMGGAGMALVFAPSANAVLSSVRVDQAGQASGATNAVREVGGVLGVAVLATVFTGSGALHVAAGLHRRPRPGDLGRGGRARGRRARRGRPAVLDPGEALESTPRTQRRWSGRRPSPAAGADGSPRPVGAP